MTWIRRWLWQVRPPVLALGGGGARGFGHLGALQVVDEQRLPVRAIAGTSMGAVIGAMYLAHGSAQRATEVWREAMSRDLIPAVRPIRAAPEVGTQEHPLVQVARRIRNRVVVSFAVNRAAVLDETDLLRAFEFLIPDLGVEDLPLPFVAVATDLETGETVHLARGPVREALRASSAIPGLLPAVILDGRSLVDGGVIAEVPIAAARSLGRPVVAVDASADLPPLAADSLVLDTMVRAQMISGRLLREYQLHTPLHVVRPQVGHAAWADWHRFDELIAAGRRAMQQFLDLPVDEKEHEAPPVGEVLPDAPEEPSPTPAQQDPPA